MHAAWADLGEEMSRIKGAVVVRRPDLVKAPAMLGPVNTLDFVKAFQSYFAIFRSSLFPTRYGTVLFSRKVAQMKSSSSSLDML